LKGWRSKFFQKVSEITQRFNSHAPAYFMILHDPNTGESKIKLSMNIQLIIQRNILINNERKMNLNRRKLISWFGLGWLASLLPSSLVGCSEATPNTSTTESVAAAPSGGFKAIGAVAQLDQNGSLLSADKKVAVVRDPQDPTKVVAVNPTCTHNGCTVEWKAANKEYVCPCHNAKFSASGAVKGGPTSTSLPKYAAKIEKGQVLVNS